MLQALAEVIKRDSIIAALERHGPKIEEHERLVRVVFVLAQEDLKVALELAGAEGLVHIADTPDRDEDAPRARAKV